MEKRIEQSNASNDQELLEATPDAVDVNIETDEMIDQVLQEENSKEDAMAEEKENLAEAFEQENDNEVLDDDQEAEEVSFSPVTKEKKKQGIWGRAKGLFGRLALAGAVTAGTAATMDATAERSHAQEKPVAKQVEKGGETEKNISFLGRIFREISGGALGKSKGGNLIVHMGGGRYYELSNSLLNELVATAGNYREKIDKANDGRVKSAQKRTAVMRITQSIMERGASVSFEQLPDNLKDFERARKDAVEDMKKPLIGQ